MILLFLACTEYDVVPDEPDPLPPVEPEPEPLPPVAVTGPGQRVHRLEPAVLDGSESWDPDTDFSQLSFHWDITEGPEGHGAFLDNPSFVQPSFFANTLGVYTLALTVNDGALPSQNPAQVAVEVVPWQELEVELSWDLAEADLDLHLLAPEGAYYGEGDCYYATPSPDWGVPGDAADDPELDQDDETGSAGERITLLAPAEGVYGVLVHYANARSTKGTARPTVRIRAEGTLVAELSGVNLNEGYTWIVGELDWSTLDWTAGPGTVTHESLGGPTLNE